MLLPFEYVCTNRGRKSPVADDHSAADRERLSIVLAWMIAPERPTRWSARHMRALGGVLTAIGVCC
ncbi:hypothetical protein [Nakamurella leprariae]|uniref:Uncharacterized protein n=1 Tax=Nakamurella leprariae TaxID=2803911 RepID=A0A939C096_9ACTN|nr:hypothetical protein [Nakamurella leprariae]MBM9465942.1 hypothetical protein [Nakamurella leprariae]